MHTYMFVSRRNNHALILFVILAFRTDDDLINVVKATPASYPFMKKKIGFIYEENHKFSACDKL